MAGRPKKSNQINQKQAFLEAAAQIIAQQGLDKLTVRNLCTQAKASTGTFYYHFENIQDLLFTFIQTSPTLYSRSPSFDQNIVDQIVEIYMDLLSKYILFGPDFMKNFYVPSNKVLASYTEGFYPESVVNNVTRLISKEQKAGHFKKDEEAAEISSDICTIVKGTVFEWCLQDGRFNIQKKLKQLLSHYLYSFLIS